MHGLIVEHAYTVNAATTVSHSLLSWSADSYSSSREAHLRATERHLPYGITQCYLPPDTPAVIPAIQAGTRFIYPGWMEG